MTRRPSYSTALRSLRLAVLFTVAALTVTAVDAATATVDCDGGPADYTTIQAAIDSLPPTEANTITITGTCIEDVSAGGFDDLVLQSGIGGATVQGHEIVAIAVFDCDSVRFAGLTIDATGALYGVLSQSSGVTMVGSELFGATDTALLSLNDSTLTLGGPDPSDAVSIHDNENGVFLLSSDLFLEGHVTIEDNLLDALFVGGGEVASRGRDVGNTVRNNGGGILLTGGDSFFSGLHVIDNNGPYGLLAIRGGRVTLGAFPSSLNGPPFFGTTISNHDVWGVVAISTNLDFLGWDETIIHSVNNNGAAPYQRDAGVWVGRHSEARLRNVTIADNFGQGVHGTLDALVNLYRASVKGNSRHGLRLSWNSTGELGSFSVLDGTTRGPNVTFSGNGRKAIKCAHGSVLAGNRSGITPIACDDSDIPFADDSSSPTARHPDAEGEHGAGDESPGLDIGNVVEMRWIERGERYEEVAHRLAKRLPKRDVSREP